MTTNGTTQNQGKLMNESMSKRQQMKLDKALKLFEAQENQQTRNHKRRAHTHIQGSELGPRKQIKIDANIHHPPSDDPISSQSNSQEPASTSPPQERQQPQETPEHLNPLYALPEGQGSLFNYLICYSYEQGEKQLEKESQDWTTLDDIGLENLSLTSSVSSSEICCKLDRKFSEQKDKIRQPFGKAHREFGQKYLKKQFLLE